MSRNRFASDSLPTEKRQQIDRLADQFEREFKAGQEPQIEAFLERLPDLRADVLQELITLEIELRRSAGQQPQAEERNGVHSQVRSRVSAICA